MAGVSPMDTVRAVLWVSFELTVYIGLAPRVQI